MTVSVNNAQVSIATTSATSTAVVAIAMAHPSSPGHSSGSEADGVVSSTALRRMYFKSARNAKTRGPSVPKVYLVGNDKKSISVQLMLFYFFQFFPGIGNGLVNHINIDWDDYQYFDGIRFYIGNQCHCDRHFRDIWFTGLG